MRVIGALFAVAAGLLLVALGACVSLFWVPLWIGDAWRHYKRRRQFFRVWGRQ